MALTASQARLAERVADLEYKLQSLSSLKEEYVALILIQLLLTVVVTRMYLQSTAQRDSYNHQPSKQTLAAAVHHKTVSHRQRNPLMVTMIRTSEDPSAKYY